jgi:hypothetical protein
MEPDRAKAKKLRKRKEKPMATEFSEAVSTSGKKTRDAAAVKKARAEIDRLREKNAKLYPGPDVGVNIIREMRDNRHPQGNDHDES